MRSVVEQSTLVSLNFTSPKARRLCLDVANNAFVDGEHEGQLAAHTPENPACQDVGLAAFAEVLPYGLDDQGRILEEVGKISLVATLLTPVSGEAVDIQAFVSIEPPIREGDTLPVEERVLNVTSIERVDGGARAAANTPEQLYALVNFALEAVG